jgi:hypothetical protein
LSVDPECVTSLFSFRNCKKLYFSIMQAKVWFNPSLPLFKFQPTALDGGLFYIMVPRNVFTPCGVPGPGRKGFCRPIGIIIIIITIIIVVYCNWVVTRWQ